MLRFVKDEFVSSTRATIGMDFCARQLAVDLLQASESSVVQRLTVQVWDTAGQEQFHSLTATYYRKAGGVMIVYDAQKRATFDHLPSWLEQVEENADEGVTKMIIAAKGGEGADEVSNEEGAAFAKQHGCLFAATSSMRGEGVIPAFKTLSSHVLAAQEALEAEREGLWLNAPAGGGGGVKAKKGGCC
jgi:small GTP-binding protein